MQDLHLTYIQYNIAWQQKAQNFKKLDALLHSVNQTDLIVLPEMFATGFSMNADVLAEPTDGATLKWMREKAQQYNAAICGSAIIKEEGAFYNRLFWVEPNGEFKTYDKRHLFTLAHEEKTYTSGKQKLHIEYKDWKITPLICYDLRFPVWCRNSNEADLMLFVANWPERRSEAWSTLLKARAIENQCYILGVNRVGNDGNEVSHSGNSALHDALGKCISKPQPFQEAIITVTLNKDHVSQTRNRFGFLNDRDAFTIH